MELESPLHTECMVSGTLRFILHLSRIMGTAPLKCKSVRDGSVIRTSKIWSLYSKIEVMIFVAFALTALTVDLSIDNETSLRIKNKANRILWVADVAVVGAVITIAVYTGSNRMRYLIDCIEQLNQVNKKLSGYRKCKSTGEATKWTVVLLSLAFGCITEFSDFIYFIVIIINNNGKVLTSFFYVFYNILCIQMHLLVIQFALITTSVVPALTKLNSCLNDKLERITKEYQNINNATLHRLTDIYCSLCDIIRELNESNGLLVVILLLSFLIKLIMTTYNLINGIFNRGQLLHGGLALQCAAFVCHVAKLAMVVEPCHQTQGQIDRTRELLNQMKRHTPSDDVTAMSELQHFSQHSSMNQVTYSPMQLFTLNRSLILAMTSSITTYLVVAIQS